MPTRTGVALTATAIVSPIPPCYCASKTWLPSRSTREHIAGFHATLPSEMRSAHTSVMSPEVAVALRPARKFRPNADPTRVPSPALHCPKRCESEYGVPVGAPPCTPLGRSGNAEHWETGIERAGNAGLAAP